MGSFRNLFSSRLLQAVAYRESPFEVTVRGEGKAYTGQEVFSGHVTTDWPMTGEWNPKTIHLSCGSSDKTGLADQSVNLVVTDPPFFDNVHSSELADFFHSWQSLHPAVL